MPPGVSSRTAVPGARDSRGLGRRRAEGLRTAPKRSPASTMRARGPPPLFARVPLLGTEPTRPRPGDWTERAGVRALQQRLAPTHARPRETQRVATRLRSRFGSRPHQRTSVLRRKERAVNLSKLKANERSAIIGATPWGNMEDRADVIDRRARDRDARQPRRVHDMGATPQRRRPLPTIRPSGTSRDFLPSFGASRSSQTPPKHRNVVRGLAPAMARTRSARSSLIVQMLRSHAASFLATAPPGSSTRWPPRQPRSRAGDP